jgi:micrococcal nuclease
MLWFLRQNQIKGSCLYESELAKKARDYVNSILGHANKITISTNKTDSFGRYLADVYVDNKNVNTELLQLGLAKKWRGKKEKWCSER